MPRDLYGVIRDLEKKGNKLKTKKLFNGSPLWRAKCTTGEVISILIFSHSHTTNIFGINNEYLVRSWKSAGHQVQKVGYC